MSDVLTFWSLAVLMIVDVPGHVHVHHVGCGADGALVGSITVRARVSRAHLGIRE
jgi:hypothetical protein